MIARLRSCANSARTLMSGVGNFRLDGFSVRGCQASSTFCAQALHKSSFGRKAFRPCSPRPLRVRDRCLAAVSSAAGSGPIALPYGGARSTRRTRLHQPLGATQPIRRTPAPLFLRPPLAAAAYRDC